MVLAVTVTTAAASLPSGGWLGFGGNLSGYSYVAAEVSISESTGEVWSRRLEGRITSQILAVRDLTEPGDLNLYVGTSKGILYAINQWGFVRAQRQLQMLKLNECRFLPEDEYGITGTPVIDERTATLYVVDGVGYLHALDLLTLVDRPGWPIRLYKDPWRHLVWGAAKIVKGKLYVGTGGLCQPGPGYLFAVDLRTQSITRWTAVPMRLGGGGGIWSWGGPVYDWRTDSILVSTGNALYGGKNVGKQFSESAGYAEHVVQLSRQLEVLAADSPVAYTEPLDLDLTGSPVIMRAPGCPALVAALNKNGHLYVWRLTRLGDGPVWSRRIATKLNGQAVWSPLTHSLYIATHRRLLRLAMTKRCELERLWSLPIGAGSINGPPTIAGHVLWAVISDQMELWAIDAESGTVLYRGSIGEAAFAPPTVIDGRVYVGGFSGLVRAFG